MAEKENPAVETPAPEPAAAIEKETLAAAPAKAEPAAADTDTAIGTTTTTVEEAGAKAPATEAVGVEGYEAEEAAFLAEGEAEKERQQAEKWEQAKAAAKKDEELSEAERTAEETAVTEETPAAATAADTAATTEAAAATSAAAVTEEDQRSDKRIRLKGLPDGHLVDAANEIARAENIPFAQAWERVAPKKAEPAAAAAAGDTAATTGATAATGLRTREEIEADITAQKTAKRKAATEMDNVAIIDAEEEIEKFKEELARVDAAEQLAEQERQNAARTKFEETVASSTTKATQYWPESADKESALSKRTLELADEYEKDPALKELVTKADSPFYFTQLAAQELGLLPKHLRKETPKSAADTAAATAAATVTKPATPTATKPAPKNQRAVVSPTQTAASPASGAARTTHGGSGIDSALEKIQGVASYEKLEEEFLTGQLA